MTKLEDLSTGCSPTWCPGCGNLAIWGAFKNAAVKSGWDNTNTVLVAGIGCHGNILNFLKLTSFEGLHGRTIPVAGGMKMANHNLNVFVFSGDGDGLGEGTNHLVHAARRNQNLTVLIHNNGLYGLTTGQTSPTTALGFKTKSTPEGNTDSPLAPLALAIASGATFVARASALDMPKLSELIIKASEHQGFAIIEILQPCITFNKGMTPVFLRENTYQLEEGYDPSNKKEAFNKSLEWGEKQVPLGVFYQVEKPTLENQLPQLRERTLIEQPLERSNLDDLFQQYT